MEMQSLNVDLKKAVELYERGLRKYEDYCGVLIHEVSGSGDKCFCESEDCKWVGIHGIRAFLAE